MRRARNTSVRRLVQTQDQKADFDICRTCWGSQRPRKSLLRVVLPCKVLLRTFSFEQTRPQGAGHGGCRVSVTQSSSSIFLLAPPNRNPALHGYGSLSVPKV